ncbi:MAG: hypothetical protein AB7K09_11200 [Planctomycetota bacterium]
MTTQPPPIHYAPDPLRDAPTPPPRPGDGGPFSALFGLMFFAAGELLIAVGWVHAWTAGAIGTALFATCFGLIFAVLGLSILIDGVRDTSRWIRRLHYRWAWPAAARAADAHTRAQYEQLADDAERHASAPPADDPFPHYPRRIGRDATRAAITSAPMPWPITLFALPFLAIGISVMLAAFDVIAIRSSVPRLVIGAIGLLFGGVGVLLIVAFIVQQVRAARTRARLAEFADQPWQDRRWNPAGTSSRHAALWEKLAGLAFVTLLAVPFVHTFFFGSGRGEWLFMIAAAGIGALAACMWLVLIVDSLRRVAGYREPFFAFGSFPFVPGRSLDGVVRWSRAPRVGRATPPLVATLRCVEETTDRRRTPKGGHADRRVGRVRYSAQHAIVVDESGRAEVHFELPPGVPPTQWAVSPPWYWEVEIDAPPRAGDDADGERSHWLWWRLHRGVVSRMTQPERAAKRWACRFVVPVYAPPAASRG